MIDTKKLADQTVMGSFDSDDFRPDSYLYSDSEVIDPLFQAAMEDHSSDFLDSLYDWWETKGFLTELQFNKLEEIAERD